MIAVLGKQELGADQMCIRDSSTLIAMLVTAYTIIFVDKLVHKNKNKD